MTQWQTPLVQPTLSYIGTWYYMIKSNRDTCKVVFLSPGFTITTIKLVCFDCKRHHLQRCYWYSVRNQSPFHGNICCQFGRNRFWRFVNPKVLLTKSDLQAYKLQRLVCIHPSVDTQTLKHYMKLAFHPKCKTLTICSTV